MKRELQVQLADLHERLRAWASASQPLAGAGGALPAASDGQQAAEALGGKG